MKRNKPTPKLILGILFSVFILSSCSDETNTGGSDTKTYKATMKVAGFTESSEDMTRTTPIPIDESLE